MLRGCSFSILGDSYSTFEGFIPKEYICYYPNPERGDNVLSVRDTWWHKLIELRGMRLLVNDSYSGSTVCTRVRSNQPASASFVARAHHSFSGDDNVRPDYILVFGGTNDSWLDRKPGKVQYGNWGEEDLSFVLPAFCYVLDQLSQVYPETKIVTVLNTGLRHEISEGILLASEHYGAICVILHDIDKQHGHPTALGMSQIADQICEVLEAHN